MAVATLIAANLLTLSGVSAAAGVHASTLPAAGAGFEVGAASVNITPPPYTPASDQLFVPACGTTAAQVAQLWPGKRLFAFEEPYIPLIDPTLDQYVAGDPYCDANHAGHYQAPWLAGPPGQDHWPTSVQPGNPVQAEAVVYALGQTRIATVVVDSIGLFNVTMDQIRADAHVLVPQVSQIFVSSTHDESAPDPIGLWGPDGTGLPGPAPTQAVLTSTALTSGVDNYYLSFLAHRAATAIARADSRLQPARLKLAYAALPSNVQECWSSYPFIADQIDPVMQAVNLRTNKVIFTLVNGNTHVETFAFSGVPADTTMFSADWAGLLRQDLAARYGGVGIEMSGLVGSVETPTVYSPASTQVVNVPGSNQNVAGNPDGCSSVYPVPATGTPVSDAFQFVTDYAQAMATSAETALAGNARTVTVHQLLGQHTSLCIQLESNLFVAAFASGIFADRPAYVDPTCSIGSSFNKVPAPAYHLPPGPVEGANGLWLKTDVAVLTVGPAQLAYVPGEMFPVTAIRGALDAAQMPFPTSCYDPTSGSYTCGTPLPMTPWITSRMTEPYRFMAGLGEDMIGYMMPPGDFVGSTLASQSTPPTTVSAPPEVNEQPWLAAELTTSSGTDRFGNGHGDDSESAGPHVGLEVTEALAQLLSTDAQQGLGHPQQVLPGLFVDSAGHLSDSPFASSGFSGAVGVVVRDASGAVQSLVPGCDARGWVTFDGTPDPGTAGTALPYSVSTAGVLLPSGHSLLVDVFAGANQLPATGVTSPLASCSPAAAVPEAPAAALLPLAGLLVLVLAGGLLWRRGTRRSPGTPEV